MDKDAVLARAKTYIAKEKDPSFRGEVEKLIASEDWDELADRFYQNLEFGTGGLRGVIGGGYNRMNTLVVKSATQGLAAYLLNAFPDKAAEGTLKAAVAFDSRRYSAQFAEAAALILAANGIRAYLFSALRPTPELSFAIRTLGCDTGIVVTASHNPAQYNGYKAYWNDGSQVIPPHDEGIIREVNAVTDIKEIERETALAKGLLKIIDKEIDEPYQDMVRRRLFRPQLIKEKAGEVKIVYTPLHGTGAFHVEAVLGSLGLKVITVPEQREGDGEFPTVSFPNPEEAPALKLALELGKKTGADVVMATDPDADRLGIAVPDREGDFALVTGNQLGTLLADYIFLSRKETGTMPEKAAMVNSIVTTGMQKLLAQSYGAECVECLTGFKWIADVWRKSEAAGSPVVVYGTEESYGYLVENEVRDKDGVSAAALTAEMTLYWRSKGKSLLDRLDELYHITGYWQEMGISKYFKGPQGPAIMKGIMENYRKSPPPVLGGIEVEKVRDVLDSVWKYPANPSRVEAVENLPKSDVLQFYLKDGTVVSARPSGTEPKIKFYASCRAEVGPGGLGAAKEEAAEKLAAIKRDIAKAIGD
ncbi:MAG: phospho-sugar mutase [Spirochaetaceae bacterium]|nr:phospho-sugar mutase [Spirochaetaceae bacterium]